MRKPQPAAPAGLDQTDLAILRALALDAQLTHKALAARLGLAESTCAYRIRTLRDRGVIRGTRARHRPGARGATSTRTGNAIIDNYVPTGHEELVIYVQRRVSVMPGMSGCR